MRRAGFIVEAELVDEIKSRGLMTKRNRSAGVITTEWVIIFRKVDNAKCPGRAYERTDGHLGSALEENSYS